MTTDEIKLLSLLRVLLLMALGCLAACGSFEEKRIRELMVEKGFGSRAHGDATRENYVGGLDAVQFRLRPDVLLTPALERLVDLTVPQPVGIDGTIFVPFVGPMYVLGKTEAELTTYVSAALNSVLQDQIDLQARIVSGQKFFYTFGEVGMKGRLPLEPDMTLVDAMYVARWTNLANLGRVYLIRPDAENPLVIDVNFRELMTSGWTTNNFQMRERDFLYVPPTFLGLIARLLQRILEPVALAVQTMLGAADIAYAADVLRGDSVYYYRF